MSGCQRRDPSYFSSEQVILKYGYNGNSFNVSSLKEFDYPVESNGFAIKYVSEGTEHYSVSGNHYEIRPGNYLLLNGRKEGKVIIDSKTNVKGICINIAPELLQGALAQILRPDAPAAGTELAAFFYEDNFLENQYSAYNTQLGKQIERLSISVHRQELNSEEIHGELFYELAYNLIKDQTAVFKQLQHIPAVKRITRNDLYKRLNRGKEFIDANFTNTISVGDIAKESAMSEFHFFRLFKQTFGLSPMQYMLRAKINLSKELLSKSCLVSNVAEICGFGDVFAFSKSFKKNVGISPSAFIRTIRDFNNRSLPEFGIVYSGITSR